MENIEAEVFSDPFPHVIFHNFYNRHELDLIWEELDFYTKPGKLMRSGGFRWQLLDIQILVQLF